MYNQQFDNVPWSSDIGHLSNHWNPICMAHGENVAVKAVKYDAEKGDLCFFALQNAVGIETDFRMECQFQSAKATVISPRAPLWQHTGMI